MTDKTTAPDFRGPNPNPDTNLVWVDTETTGLDHDTGALLEVACIVTTQGLDPIACYSSVIRYPHGRDHLEARMHADVLAMHWASGLFLDVLAGGAPELEEVQDQLVAFIGKHTTPGTAPMCGNTIRFDRAWLARHMPKVIPACHYRSVDVSSIKELVRRWGLPQYPAPKDKAHRALPDVKVSLEEARWYRDHVFTPARKWHALEVLNEGLRGILLEDSVDQVNRADQSDPPSRTLAGVSQ
jgi:oligoribonuclease